MIDLKTIRKERKISQAEIADFLKISQRTYSSYELGQTEPSLSTLIRLADFYGTSVDYLLEREQKSPLVLEEQKEAFNYLRELKGPYLQMATGYLKKLAEDQNQISNLKYRG